MQAPGEATAPAKPATTAAFRPSHGPARWARPLVRIDALWTKIESWLVLMALIGAILYSSGWVVLNSFHTQNGRLAYFPGGVLTFAGIASGLAWSRRKLRDNRRLAAPISLFVVGVVLLLVAKKQDYFANVAHWLEEASLIKQVGTPQLVTARLFTIWVALLGGSLATGSGRQINIDVVMRFLGPRPRLIIALIGYVAASVSCFVVSWAFVDYIAITRYEADQDAKASEKISLVAHGVRRHLFVFRKQLVMDVRSFGHVVLAGQKYDTWWKAEDWNDDLNEGGWGDVYPPKPPKPGEAPPPPPPVPYPTKPCLSGQELADLTLRGGSTNPDWTLPGLCADAGSVRPPLITPPDPDEANPFDADLALLFPWGFFVIGLRFLLRGALAAGGAVSTDPNAAHGGEPSHTVPASDAPTDEGSISVHPPLAETKVDQEARAHEGERSLPSDDVNAADLASASQSKLESLTIDVASGAQKAEAPKHVVENVGDPNEGRETAKKITVPPPAEARRSSVPPPPDGIPTAQKLEAARAIAEQEEEERTLVGDLSELAKAEELRALREETEKKKREAAKAKETTPKKPDDPKKGGK